MQLDVALDDDALEELQKALRFFYPGLSVRRPPGGLVDVQAPQLTDDELRPVVDHFLRGHRAVRPKVIVDRTDGATCDHGLPADDRIAVADGVFVQGRGWAPAQDATRALVREWFGARFGAPHVVGSALIPRTVLLRAGYYRKFPNMVNRVSRLRNSYWDAVAATRLATDLATDAGADLSALYEPADVDLNPVTCYHVYANAKALIAQHDTMLFSIDGPVFRYESANHDTTRLAEFTMYELVRMGTADEVRREHERLVDAFDEFFRRVGVPYRIVTASDPFYGDEPALARDAQMFSCGKYEVRIPLAGCELSVGSVNLHGRVFADAFGLAELGDIEATCCAGIGIERLTYAREAYRKGREAAPC